jgi:hypothetical protein
MCAVDAAGAMGERCSMKLLATIVTVALLGLVAVAPGAAQSAGEGAVVRDASASSKPSRARTRVLVRPAYPYRRYHSLYPLPDGIDYPGPKARRVCSGGLVTEYRPSGTVTVPRLRCWWARG